MGIDVRVESESGEVQDEVLDDYNLTEQLLPERDDLSSHCLRFVDPDGDTVFNQLQIPVLLQELQKRIRGSSKADIRNHAQALIKLIEAAQGEDRTCVRFSGE